MTKKQKAWLEIFLGMFIVPEILWSPVVNFIYEWGQRTNHVIALRNNFFTKSDNIDAWGYILLFQFFGLLFATIYLIFIRKSFQNKIAFWISLALLIIATIIMFFIHGLSTIRISF